MGFLIMGAFGLLCALTAHSKGRSVIAWFLLGFFFPLLALILILCLSNLREESEIRERSDREQRRLREQLRQEKLKNEAFRRQVGRRLDAHDDALGLETRPAGYLSASSDADEFPPDPQVDFPPEDLRSPLRLPASRPERLWYVVQDGREIGPLKHAKLIHLIQSGDVNAATLVWTKGMGEQRPLAEVPELADLLDSQGPSRP